MAAAAAAQPHAVRPAANLRGPAAGLADFLARARPGESGSFASPEASGGAVHVTMEEEYHAASGRVCRELTMAEGGAPPAVRVACRDQGGAWELLPQLRNRELPRAHALPVRSLP